jgi:hypothetical protein
MVELYHRGNNSKKRYLVKIRERLTSPSFRIIIDTKDEFGSNLVLQSIEGVYKHGKIELVELPLDVSESRVIVTFLEPETTRKQTQMIQFGIFSGRNQSTEEDFETAEFYGVISIKSQNANDLRRASFA